MRTSDRIHYITMAEKRAFKSFTAPVDKELFGKRCRRKTPDTFCTLYEVEMFADYYARFLDGSFDTGDERHDITIAVDAAIGKSHAEEFCRRFNYSFDHILETFLPKLEIPF